MPFIIYFIFVSVFGNADSVLQNFPINPSEGDSSEQLSFTSNNWLDSLN